MEELPGRKKAMRLIHLFALGVFLMPLMQWTPAQAAANCTELRAEIEAAGSTPSSARLKSLHDQAVALTDCDNALIEHLLRRIAVAMSREANAVSAATPERQATLEASLQYHRLWQVLKQLGDIAYEVDDYVAATRRYQQTLEAIDDPETTADNHVPERAVVEEIYKLAEVTRLLADEYVAAPVNRAGDATGLGAPSVRGYTFSVVAIPITFLFDQTRFDPQGMLAAQDLLATLMAQGAPDITLIGHTDPTGRRRYNQGLSQRRAQAVEAFLRQGGYTGRIRTEGRGEDEPLVVPNPQSFSKRELFRMFRRVELRR
jgi:outer membrane protein OmpA-like peptidoglycan-associated protein